MELELVSFALFVEDVTVSRHFYEDIIGQKVVLDFGENVGYESGLAIWQKKHALQTIFGRQVNSGKACEEIYFETPDLDDALEKLQAHDVKFIHGILEQPWGQRVMRFYDPDEHIIEIGEPMPVTVQRFAAQGMNPEQVAKRTSMPLEIVKQILGKA